MPSPSSTPRPHPQRRLVALATRSGEKCGLATDLLAQARLLATKEPRRPQQVSLRRAVSASYYALFHLLVADATRRLVPGRERESLRNCLSRAFDHSSMRRAADRFAQDNVPAKLLPGLNGLLVQNQLVSVATAFSDLQQYRHAADYDVARRFTRLEALAVARVAERAFDDWHAVRKSVQADAFLVGLLALDKMRAN